MATEKHRHEGLNILGDLLHMVAELLSPFFEAMVEGLLAFIFHA